jgi:hypothetical protein
MEADLETAIGVTLIDLAVALDPNLAFRISAAGMDDGPGAALTSPTMADIHSFRLPRGNYPKRAAMALRRSLHRLPPEFTLSVYVTFAIGVEHVESLAGPRELAMHF